MSCFIPEAGQQTLQLLFRSSGPGVFISIVSRKLFQFFFFKCIVAKGRRGKALILSTSSPRKILNSNLPDSDLLNFWSSDVFEVLWVLPPFIIFTIKSEWCLEVLTITKSSTQSIWASSCQAWTESRGYFTVICTQRPSTGGAPEMRESSMTRCL